MGCIGLQPRRLARAKLVHEGKVDAGPEAQRALLAPDRIQQVGAGHDSFGDPVELARAQHGLPSAHARRPHAFEGGCLGQQALSQGRRVKVPPHASHFWCPSGWSDGCRRARACPAPPAALGRPARWHCIPAQRRRSGRPAVRVSFRSLHAAAATPRRERPRRRPAPDEHQPRDGATSSNSGRIVSRAV